MVCVHRKEGVGRRSAGKLPIAWAVGAVAVSTALCSTSATAQTVGQDSSVLVRPAVPDGFDRGGNISVIERSRPDYDPLGINAGGFLLYPRVGAGIGVTSNVYLTPTDKADAFAVVSPSLVVRSNWSRHALELRGSGVLSRYFQNSPRNNDNYDLGGKGRLDISSGLVGNAEAQFAQVSENPDAGALSANLAALSIYRRSFFHVGGLYQSGQGRLIATADRTHFAFSNIPLTGGTFINQSDRDRTVNRVAVQAEYARTPSFYVYVQGSYSRTLYDRALLSGLANRNSKSFRVLGGVSLDLAGLLRGQIAVGYTRRTYDSPLYSTAAGFSAEGKLEYFPSELTTLTLQVARTLEDANIGATNAYFDNRIALRADHELLRNFLIGIEGRYSRQRYLNLTDSASGYGVQGTGRYLASHHISLEGKAGYTHRNSSLTSLPYSELRGDLTLIYAF